MSNSVPLVQNTLRKVMFRDKVLMTKLLVVLEMKLFFEINTCNLPFPIFVQVLCQQMLFFSCKHYT